MAANTPSPSSSNISVCSLSSTVSNVIFTLDERFDRDAAKAVWRVQDNGLEIPAKKALVRTHSECPDGKYQVTYEMPEHGYGRFKATSLGVPMKPHVYQWKELRDTLCHEIYHDVDMVNCHPNLALQFCERRGLPHDAAFYYSDNREEVLKDVMEAANVERESAKNLFCRLAYGGSVAAWRAAFKVPMSCVLPPIVDAFKKEMDTMQDVVAHHNPELVKIVLQQKQEGVKKVSNNIESSVTARYFQTIERKAITAIVEKAQEMGFVVGAIIYDGMLVEKEQGLVDIDDVELTNRVLATWERAAKEATGYSVQLDIKNMKPVAALLEGPHRDWEESIFDGEMRDYAVVKEIFEKNHFFVVDLVCYMKELDNGQLSKFSEAEIHQAYRHLQVMPQGAAEDRDKPAKPMAFTKIWICDPKKRVYEKLAFLPPPQRVPADCYNTFRGFAAEFIPDSVEASGNIDPFLHHIGVLCNHEPEQVEYIIKYLAHLIQRPGDQTNNVMGLIYSPSFGGQGAGKSMAFELLGKHVIGMQYFLQTADIEHLLGKHAEAVENKLFILFEEVSGSDTARHRDNLFNLITAPTIQVNPKGIRPYKVDNFVRIWSTTNSDQSIPGGRRFFITDASLEHVGDSAYFAGFASYMSDPTHVKTIFHHLKNEVDISAWHAETSRPITAHMQTIAAVNVPPEVLLFKLVATDMVRERVATKEIPSSALVRKFVRSIMARTEEEKSSKTMQNRYQTVLPERIRKEHAKAVQMGAITKLPRVSSGIRYLIVLDKMIEYLAGLGIEVEQDFTQLIIDDADAA